MFSRTSEENVNNCSKVTEPYHLYLFSSRKGANNKEHSLKSKNTITRVRVRVRVDTNPNPKAAFFKKRIDPDPTFC